jgi:ferrous iron transport protein A
MLRMADLPVQHLARVAHLDRTGAPVGMCERLEEIGFLPNEQVMVMASGTFGGDPLVVRVGGSTFALRRDEAAMVLVHAETHRVGA